MLTELPEDVREELEDPRFITRKHYSRSTYALGCHGPFCRKAEKDRGRERSAARAKGKGRAYVPNKKIQDNARDGLLDQLIDEYLHSRKPRAKAS